MASPTSRTTSAPDALLVNFKAVTLRFVPDDGRREVRVTAEPALADFAVGAIAYVDGPCGDWRSKALPDFTRGDRIAFAGTYAAECGEQTWNVSVLDHRQYVGALFRSLWTDLGGTLAGTVRDGITPTDARVLVEHESPSLSEVVRDINKYSNNVMARELFLSMGAEVSKMPGNADRAQRVVRSFYASKNLAMPELVLENGSGLSRRERISPLSMARVLQAAWASPVMPEFIASLPLVGFRRHDAQAAQPALGRGAGAHQDRHAGRHAGGGGLRARRIGAVLRGGGADQSRQRQPRSGGSGRAAAVDLRTRLRALPGRAVMVIRPTPSTARFPHDVCRLLARLGPSAGRLPATATHRRKNR